VTSPFLHAHFESERLTMRPQSEKDAEALYEAYGDEGVMTYWSSPHHTSVQQTREYLQARDMPSEWRGWVMVAKHGGAIVGTLATHDTRPRVAEIGYLVLRRYWGAGYAREGVARLIDLLFGEENYRRIVADTDPDNDASNGLLQRLGFTCEARLRAEWETHIGIRDSYIWGMLAEEWRR
jgi:RimJ/RimL family protein N-acetyltransferase